MTKPGILSVMAVLFFIIAILVIFPSQIIAFYNPLSVANNRYGMHIADVNDIADVAQLVNSSGGDWGYVTVVIEENDRKHEKWQELFNQMRRLHLIPLIRLATTLEGDVWKIPKEESIDEWVNFLNNLNWPIENRYIILFNEPNHAKEWGNRIDPEGYGKIAASFARALKLASEDFFILPAGFDASATTSKDTLDESVFLRRMVRGDPEILTLIDGWTSHAYPNPDFQGLPGARGRGSLGTFQWELTLLRSLGNTRDLPIFITETGWTHREGKVSDPSLVSPEIVSSYISAATRSIWQDPQIAAITPFIFNYQDIPFDHFSFRRIGNNGYYPHYDAYSAIEKIRGEPKQRHQYVINQDTIPKLLVTDSHYTFELTITNTGQGILDAAEGFEIIVDTPTTFEIIGYSIPRVEPAGDGTLVLQIKTPLKTGRYPLLIRLKNGQYETVLTKGEVTLIPPPALNISLYVPPKTPQEIPDTRVIVTSGSTEIQTFDGLTVIGGNIFVPDLANIVPGRPYDITVEIAGYFTKTRNTTVTSEVTHLAFGKIYPFDVNGNGVFDVTDVGPLLMQPPIKIIRFLMY